MIGNRIDQLARPAAPRRRTALRHGVAGFINEQKSDDPIVNNTVSVQAAIWSEAFDEQSTLDYRSATEPYGILDVVQQRQSSWRFWFNPSGHPVRDSLTGNIINSYHPGDDALVDKMRLNDWVKRGTHIRDRSTYYAQLLRTASNLWDRPTLVRSDAHTSSILQREDLRLPIGTMENPLADININARDFGWRNEEHSDFKVLAYPVIYPWYRNALRNTGAIAIGEE